jgi:transposase-like protein
MAKNVVKQIRKATRRRFSAEEKIRIVLEGLRGEIPVTERFRSLSCAVERGFSPRSTTNGLKPFWMPARTA